MSVHVHDAIHAGYGKDVAAFGKDAWILVQIYLAVWPQHKHISLLRLYVIAAAILTELVVRALFAANRWALATASKLLCTALRTRQSVARCGARQLAR